MAVRDLKIDGLKLFLVCLVVLGHCIQPFRFDYVGIGWLYGIIYSFHMPLFIILSGYFFKIEDRKKEVKKCLLLLETFVVVTFVFWLSSGMSYSWPFVRIGGCPSWYLFSLVCWRGMSHWALRRLSLNSLLIGSLIVGVLVFKLLNKGEELFGVMRTVQFYPYFLLGYAIRQYSVDLGKQKRLPYFIAAIVSIVVIMAFSSYALYSLEFQSIGLQRWCKQFSKSIFVAWEGYFFVKISSIAISFSVEQNIQLPDKIASFGSSSLLVYSVHTMILPLMFRYCVSLWLMLILGIISIVISLWLSRSKLSVYITNPISNLLLLIKTNI